VEASPRVEVVVRLRVLRVRAEISDAVALRVDAALARFFFFHIRYGNDVERGGIVCVDRSRIGEAGRRCSVAASKERERTDGDPRGAHGS